MQNEEQIEPELQPEDMFKVCFILLNILGGQASIPKETLDNFPTDANLTFDYDKDSRRWTFYAPTPKSKRKRGIIKPKQRLILPN